MSAASVRNMFATMVALAMAITVSLTAPEARAQENLDRDKSGQKLFAATCAQCHRSPRGLSKGRISFLLTYYLRQHYTSSAASAQTLSAYLQAVDTPPAKSKTAARKARPAEVATTGSAAPRPPATVPVR
jgi:mono/diheme cytochrome c family protein